MEQDASHSADYFKLLQRNEFFFRDFLFIYSFHLVSPQTKPNPEVLIRLDARVEITKHNHKTLLPHDKPEAHAPRKVNSDENSGSCGGIT